jgi:hypothetical protein
MKTLLIILLGEYGFVRCEKGKYYRLKIYGDDYSAVYLEIDTKDNFASFVKRVKFPTRQEEITKICLPNKLTKERLLKLLEILK